jgi:hypothetical protein
MRMMRNILLPAAFLGGFLTAVIIGIKVIGVMNMILISKVLMLNLGIFIGKLFIAKAGWFDKSQNHFHNHYQSSSYPLGHPTYSESLFSHSRADDFSRKFEPTTFHTNPQQLPQHYNQLPVLFSNTPQQQQQQLFPTTFIQSPPTNFQPQMNEFGGIQMQTSQQIHAASQINQPYNQPIQQQQQQYQQLSNINSYNEIQQSTVTTETPGVKYETINSNQPSLSPLEMENILMNALSRLSEKENRKDNVSTARSTSNEQQLVRNKRKSSNQHPRLQLSLFKSFS